MKISRLTAGIYIAALAAFAAGVLLIVCNAGRVSCKTFAGFILCIFGTVTVLSNSVSLLIQKK